MNISVFVKYKFRFLFHLTEFSNDLTKSSKSPASIAKSKRASERLLESSTKYLEEKLKLTVNREKLNEILTGYLHYYGITDNSERITAFRYNVMKSYNFKYQGRSRSLIFKYSTSLKDILNRNSVMGSFKSALPISMIFSIR